MKKRLLSLVLCLVMVFSLFPAINLDALAIVRPYAGYVEIDNTNWTPASNYDGRSYGGTTSTLYYQDAEGNYWPVTVDRGDVFTATAVQDWKPGDISGSAVTYYYSADEQTFSAVSTTRGTGYEATTQQFDNNLFSPDVDDYHDKYYSFTTNYYVRYEHDGIREYRRLLGHNKGNILDWGDSFSFQIKLFYLKDEGTNDFSADSNVFSVEGETWVAFVRVSRKKTNENWFNNLDSSNIVTVKIAGSENEYVYRRQGVGYKEDMYDTYYTTLGQTLYRKITIDNSIVYGTNNTRLPGSSIVYDTETTAWNGKLYTATHNRPYKLSYTDDNGTHVLGQTKLSNGQIYGDKLFYYSDHAVMPTPTPTSIITTDETGEDGVYTSKELTPNGDAYDVTLTAYTTGNKVTTSTETVTPVVKPMDIVMVIDQSGSMATQDMGNDFDNGTNKSWTVEEATGGVQYYYSPDNGLSYYPVYASTGYVYEKVDGSPRASDMLGSGDDAISLGVNGAPTYYNISTDYYVMHNGELHQLRLITAGLFLQYGLYPYIYTNEQDAYAGKGKWEGNNYWVAVFDPWDGSDLRDNKVWNSLTDSGAASSRVSFVNTDGQAIGSTDGNANSARLSYSWFTSSARISNLYQKSSTKVANQLYYIDSAGNHVNIGTTAQYAGDTVFTGKLYQATGTSRVNALKAAVTQFANAVQQNALTKPEHPVDHRMAFVGFAGNKVPAYSLGADAVTVGSNGLADYTNTGLFFNGGFENYEKITGYERTTDQYINRHYYQSNMPVKYSDGWYRLNLETGARTSTYYSSSNWYKATYEGNGTSLSAADYRAALVSVNSNGALNSSISNVISQFAANGGTYTSYGMTMAEQLYKAVEDAGDTRSTDSEGQPADRQRVIIVFTDGEPGANGYNSSIAGEALVSGNLAKTEQGALVYTVGLFKSAPSSQVADFMQKLSSEYDMTLSKVYGGADNDNYSLGGLDPNKTYYYKNETTGKYYAVTTEYGTGSSLGWWIYNGSASGETESYSLTNPRRSTGAGTTVFYNANGSSVNGEDVVTGRTYYTSGGDKIVYEYRWFDSDRSIKNPNMDASGSTTSAGEARVQFYELTGAAANDDGLSYYLTASSASELNNVFAQIAGSLIEQEVTVTNGSLYTEDTMYVMDEISADFDLPSDLSAENNHVTVYAEKPSGWVLDHEETDAETGAVTQIHKPNWDNSTLTLLEQGDEEAIRAGDADVKVTWEGKKLKVEYFDFGRMYMQQSNPDAARIRVVISGITPNHAGEKLYSNTPQSGLYYKDPDPENDTVTLVEAFNRPYISVPGYTVKWVDDQGTNMANPYDQDTDLIKGDVPVYDGGEPMKDSVVVENVSRTDYTFDGWSTTPGGDKVINITRDAESGVVTDYGTFPAVVNSDVTYYAHFSSEVKSFYTATWYNGTTELYKQPGLANGDVPEYGGAIPAKDADNTYTYFFAGWYDEAAHTRNGETYVAADVITQLPAINGADVNYYAVFAPVKIDTETYVLEYSTKNVIRDSGVYGFDAIYTPGGEFGQDKAEGDDTGSFFFVPMLSGNAQYASDKNIKDMTGFSKVNTGVFYEGADSTKPTKVNVIPGSSVYFDDSLMKVSASVKNPDTELKTFDYEAALEGVNAGETDTDSIAKNTTLTFKFTGTRIDVYCTTEEGSKSVKAAILDDDGNLVGNLTGIVNNHADNTRYNVPTVSFVMPEYGTYTLQLRNINATYKLDGVRVYNSLADDSVYEASEQNALFLNLRSKLVTGLKAELDAYAKALEDYEAGTITEEPAAPEAVAFYNEKGSTTTADYITNSPKNEIYLAPREKIAFAIKGYSTYTTAPTVMIGLSIQNGTQGEATINGVKQSLKAVTDSYYTVNMAKTGQTGYVVIENTGTVNISLTNLRISGVSSADIDRANTATAAASVLSVNETADNAVVEPKLIFTKKLMSFVENPEYVETASDPTPAPSADPTVQPTQQPTLQDMVRQFISDFVRNLFGSIGRLFGN